MHTLNQLVFDLTHLTSPNNINDKDWGHITLTYIKNHFRETLLDCHWNVNELQKWFNERKEALLTEDFPYHDFAGKSIAEARSILFDREEFQSNAEQDEYYEKLAEYFDNHYLFIRGTSTPRFYIGLNNGKGEISRYDDSGNLLVKYFDLPKFIYSTQKALQAFNITNPT